MELIEKQILFSIDDAIREVSDLLVKDHQTEMLYINIGQIIALYATKDIINRQLRYAYEDRIDGGTNGTD